MTLKELRQKRGTIVEQMNALNDKALEEKRSLTPYEKLGGTPRALHAGETRFEQATVEVLGNASIIKPSPEAVASLESLLPHSLDGLVVDVKELIEGGCARVAPSVGRRANVPARPESGRHRHRAHNGGRRKPSSMGTVEGRKRALVSGRWGAAGSDPARLSAARPW